MWNPETYRDTDYGLAEGESFEPEIENVEIDPVSIDGPHIMTLLGPIAPEELGICLPRVHLMRELPGSFGLDYQLTNQDAAESEVEAFVSMNGRSLVECSTPDTGRMIAPLLEIAGWVPAHLIGVAGRCVDRFSSRMHNSSDREALVDEFLADVGVGMDGTDARAGVLHVGVSAEGPTEIERAALDAAASVHEQTGVPITTITDSTQSALNMLVAFRGSGVTPGRVIVGHVDTDSRSLEDLLAIAQTGAFVQFDQIGKRDQATDQHTAERVCELVSAGFRDQILMSLDYGRRSLMTGYHGTPGLSYLSEWFMVLLMEAGLDALTIRSLVIDNPARALTIHPPGRM